MSLVDYDVSSSDDDDDRKEKPPCPQTEASPAPYVARTVLKPKSSPAKQEDSSGLPPPMIEKLPDASLLLNSPTIPLVSGNDHASRVAAARAESALRKRDRNGHPSSLPRSKLPKGKLAHSKNIPETVGSLLLPPQLKGRSNVATEDIGKLFVKKQPDSGARGSPSQA
ncbi:PREDICTED: uncharacterized protein LOC104819111 [Tarenaya hassleriana]|uniref:uncharacterized protein LOC104819111 n=1 Tax=Tarenaya hassleriana TaxID=28532 RepID=UPI00053CA858|nr:PREDICTED: uncharacterized protein LOC104819111 [Tarenaya hassleriana]